MGVKGLRLMIYPFAPDQSGASSVLYELGGMVIICDAGGCAGNVCGFDEPRWLGTKSAVFSAGLRDMDAILGRDDLLIKKISKAAKRLEAGFIAIIGTPVPATIATDYKALRRMAEKKTGLPVITIDTNGAAWYDEGIEKAYLECFRRFAEDAPAGRDESGLISGEYAPKQYVIPGSVGVIGITPLDMDKSDAAGRISEVLKSDGYGKVACYGCQNPEDSLKDPDGEMNCTPCVEDDAVRGILSGLDAFRSAGRMEKNIVVAAAGLKAARYLRDRFGTPYECRDPLIEEVYDGLENALIQAYRAGRDETSGIEPQGLKELAASNKILIIHQQVRANALRDEIRRRLGSCEQGAEQALKIDAATWFMMDDEIREAGDFRIRDEEEFFRICGRGDYGVIIADSSLRRAAVRGGFGGVFLELPHFAISGEYRDEESVRLYPE